MTLLVEILIILSSLIISAYFYVKHAYTYWARKNIPYLKPKFPKGNLQSALPKGISMGLESEQFYQEFKKENVRYGGVYAYVQPMLLVRDLDIIKDILIKDFQMFEDRGVYHNEKSDPMTTNLFTQYGPKWKSLRSRFSPTFTSGKLKQISKTVAKLGDNMTDYLENLPNKDELNVRYFTQGFSLDVISNTIFGLECDGFKNPNSEFRRMAFNVNNVNIWQAIQFCFAIYFPGMAKKLGAKLTNQPVSDFFTRIVQENLHYRETNKVVKPDFFQALVELKNSKNEGDKIDFNEMTGQTFLFFVAGFETSSLTMMYCLYELAANPALQEKTRRDILEGIRKNNGELDYDAVNEMKYLKQVVDETLRMYPPVPTLTRKAIQDYKIDGTKDVIEKGTMVLIPAYAIQRDADFWEDPSTFNPDRFSETNKKSIHSCAYLPFGTGPRNCIGMRFGLMQAEIGLCCLLSKYKFSINPKMKPIQFDREAFALLNKNDILLNAEKI